jgi:hypothetical protein
MEISGDNTMKIAGADCPPAVAIIVFGPGVQLEGICSVAFKLPSAPVLPEPMAVPSNVTVKLVLFGKSVPANVTHEVGPPLSGVRRSEGTARAGLEVRKMEERETNSMTMRRFITFAFGFFTHPTSMTYYPLMYSIPIKGCILISTIPFLQAIYQLI